MELCKRHGAHGIGVGWKVTSGQKTDRLALLFYVEHKLPINELDERVIPKSFSFIAKGQQDPVDVEIITDVIEAPPAVYEE